MTEKNPKRQSFGYSSSNNRLSFGNCSFLFIIFSPRAAFGPMKGFGLLAPRTHVVSPMKRLAYETTWRCQKNPFIGALGIQEPVMPGEPLIEG